MRFTSDMGTIVLPHAPEDNLVVLAHSIERPPTAPEELRVKALSDPRPNRR